MRCILPFLCIGFLALLSVHQVTAYPPAGKVAADDASRYLSYEGVLASRSGEALSGEYPMTFRLYDSPAGGASLWEEQSRVQVEDGTFRVTLGRHTPLPAMAGVEYYVGVSIGGEELLPRHPVAGSGIDEVTAAPVAGPPTATPYFPVAQMDYRYINVTGDTMSGDLLVDASVGIGTLTPGTPLDVSGDIRTDSRLISTLGSGTAPLSVAFRTLVPNLNADYLDDLSSEDLLRR